MKMSELGLVEYFSMAEALGIIATMLIVRYFFFSYAPKKGIKR
jgi:hypothetical protein